MPSSIGVNVLSLPILFSNPNNSIAEQHEDDGKSVERHIVNVMGRQCSAFSINEHFHSWFIWLPESCFDFGLKYPFSQDPVLSFC